MVFAIVVAVILTTGVLTPVINEASKDTETVPREGGMWMNMGIIEDGSDFSIQLDCITDPDEGDVGFSVSNGTDTQQGSVPESVMIVYADENTIVVAGLDGYFYIVQHTDEGTALYYMNNHMSISRSNGQLTLEDENYTYTSTYNGWCYVPETNGGYACYSDGDVYITGKDAYFGTYGITPNSIGTACCYNGYSMGGSAITPQIVYDGDVATEIVWKNMQTPIQPAQGNDSEDSTEDETVQSGTLPVADHTEGDWGYNVDANNNAVVVSYNNTVFGDDITIPSTLGGYPVTGVGIGTEGSPIMTSDSQINTLTIPASVKTINAYAFQGIAGLSNIALTNGLESIGAYAFQNSHVAEYSSQSIEFPSTMTTVGSHAFADNGNLSDIKFYGDVRIEDYAFANTNFSYINYDFDNDTALQTIRYIGAHAFENSTVMDWGFLGNTQYIGEFAFNQEMSGAYAENLVLTDNVEYIGVGAFYGQDPSAVQIGNVQTIEGGIFNGECEISSLTVTEGNQYYRAEDGVLYSADMTKVICFTNAYPQTTYSLPDSITTVMPYAFNGYENVEIYINEYLTSIGDYAFNDCGIRNANIFIPGNNTYIGNYAFGNISATTIAICTDEPPEDNAFSGLTVNNILDLSAIEYSTDSYGISAQSVDDQVEMVAFINPTESSTTVTKEGGIYTILAIIPLLLIVGTVVCTIGLLRSRF